METPAEYTVVDERTIEYKVNRELDRISQVKWRAAYGKEGQVKD